MDRIYKVMAQNERSEQIFVISFVFWTICLLLRTVAFFNLQNEYPKFSLPGISLYYSLVGLILILLAVSILFKKRDVSIMPLLFLGIGLGFIADEAWSVLGLAKSGSYWSIGNLFTTVLAGSVLLILQQISKKNTNFSIEYNGEKHHNPQNPKISVVIPAYNEEKFIDTILKSLNNQTYKNFELIVVDNNSSDKTSQVAKSFGARVVSEKNPGVANARQAGFSQAKGKIIATTDSDSVIPGTWVERIVKEYESDSSLVGFGGLGFLYSGPITARAAGRYFFEIFWVIDKILSGGWNLVGFNMSVKKEVFDAIGGFRTDLTLGEDVDLSQRLRKVGKVKIERRFNVFVSGRRYRHGLFNGVMVYAPSWFMRVVFRKEKFLNFPAVRSEGIISSRLSLLPFASALFLLFAFFYSKLR